MSLPDVLRQAVRERAGDCCEYCRLPHTGGTIPFHVDHIRPLKHRGTDDPNNLCYACYQCNSHKGANISGYDPDTDELTRLFDPRIDQWNDHFSISENSRIFGHTPIGRTTLDVLNLNDPRRVKRRYALQHAGAYPCKSN